MEAREILAATPPIPDEPDDSEREREALEALGRRVRWCICSVLFYPLGIPLGVLYLVRASRSRVRPSHHVMTVLVFLLTILLQLVFLAPLLLAP